MSDRIISKGPIRSPIESGVGDAPQSSPKSEVPIRTGSSVKIWVSNTSQGRFVDADRISTVDPQADRDEGWAATHDRIMKNLPPSLLERVASIKIARKNRGENGS